MSLFDAAIRYAAATISFDMLSRDIFYFAAFTLFAAFAIFDALLRFSPPNMSSARLKARGCRCVRLRRAVCFTSAPTRAAGARIRVEQRVV